MRSEPLLGYLFLLAFFSTYLVGVGGTIYAQVTGNNLVGWIGLISVFAWLYGPWMAR